VRRIIVVAALVVLAPLTARGALVLGFADEFWLGTVEVYAGTSCATAQGVMFTFNSSTTASLGLTHQPSFETLGQQTLAGKTNARAKVMFRFNVKNCSNGAFYSESTTITRFSFSPGSVPGSGSTCTGGTGVGTSVQTFDSQSAGASGQRIQNRLLPVFDFSAQASTGVFGYRDNVAVTSGVNESSCYRISWL
jgi:hypothetical protein